jgi:alpha-L-fucosidase
VVRSPRAEAGAGKVKGTEMTHRNACVQVLCVGALSLLFAPVLAQQGPFEPTWESLAKHDEAPEWFRDAKFGIYFHWGVYCVPAFGDEWYPRNMHIKGSREYKHHVETWGDPTELGYHDFVPMFKAEKFDAEEWAALFEEAGARFAGPVAEHHDGFSMWDSDLTPWNAADMGPKRDITGELAAAIRKRGMRLVTTFHHARNNLWQKNGTNWTGHYDRVKTDFPSLLEDPQQAILYGYIPRDKFLEMWKGKLIEVIDKYHPDLMWFDSWLDEIPDAYKMAYLAHYFNDAARLDKGVVVTFKQQDLPQDVAVLDLEKGRMDKLTDFAWLTDDTISMGSWCYTQDLKIKPTRQVLHSLIDIVSKNGQLLLNISPKADGSIPPEQQKVLRELGAWLKVNGEAIYNTRPWYVFGEGPTNKNLPRGHFGGVADPAAGYTPQDIRFTRSKDGNTLYAIVLGSPAEKSELIIRSFGKDLMRGDLKVKNVSMLGSKAKIAFQMRDDGLAVTAPAEKVDGMAVVFKIETSGSATILSEADVISLSADAAVLDGDRIQTETKYGRSNIGYWDDPAESAHWLVRITRPGLYLVRGEFAAASAPSKLTLRCRRTELTCDVPKTAGWDKAQSVEIGTLTFDAPGVYHLSVRPASPETWKAVNLYQLKLIRME